MKNIFRPIDFFVIGAARAGTTTLYNYLSQHPAIFLPRVKECNFFSDVESLDQEVYQDPKPNRFYHMKIIRSEKKYQSLFQEAENHQIIGEISPSYLWDLSTAARIQEHNPKAKIIVSLRNPIERALSHYLMHYNTGYEKEVSFEDALKSESNPIWGGGNNYLEMSEYYDQIKQYFELFKPDQIKVMVYEEWIRNPVGHLNDIYKFLGTDPYIAYSETAHENPTKNIKNREILNFLRQPAIKSKFNYLIPKKVKETMKDAFFTSEEGKPNLSKELKLNLKNRFKPQVKKLEKLVDKPLISIWKLEND